MSYSGAIADIRLGTDVAYIPRFQAGWQRFGDRFLTKIYTPAERDYCLRSPAHAVLRLAGRWAAKEAVVKALGTGWRGVGYREVEIVRCLSGAPSVQLYGRAEALVRKWSGSSSEWDWRLSFSHDEEYVFAAAVLLMRDR